MNVSDMQKSRQEAYIREFRFSDENFDYLRNLVYQHSGIQLVEAKRDLVYGRLSRRIRALGYCSFDEYCALLAHSPGEELMHCINAITTNLTAFFREHYHFEFLIREILPQVEVPRLRIWSAGCSTGEEPYSIAISLLEKVSDWDVKILATDLDSNVLQTARNGAYKMERMAGISKQRLKRWFRCGRGNNENMAKVVLELQTMIQFSQLNLMSSWPIRGPLDMIFCRNVIIYFDKETQRTLVDRFASLIKPGGYLFLGHAETLFSVSDRFESLGKTVYRKLR